MNTASINVLKRELEQRPTRLVYEGTRDDLFAHLKSEALRHKSLYHYTQWDNFVKMMTPIADGGECNGHRVMLLSRASEMNDKTEKGWGKSVYFTCFSYSKYEDVAMWMNYGKRSPNAVRVRFDGIAIREWFNVHSMAKDCVYSADEKNGVFEFRRIFPENIASVEYADVAYVIHDKLMSRRHCGNVEYGRDFFVVKGDDGGFVWSNDVYDGVPRRTVKGLPAFFKKRGWGYERETRLVITLKPGVRAPKRIAIIFDDVFRRFDVLTKCNVARTKQHGLGYYDVDEEAANNILMQGPWYDEKFSSNEIVGSCGIGFSDVQFKSDYGREIDIISSVNKTPMQQYREALSYVDSLRDDCAKQITKDDKAFLRPLSRDLRSAAKTINRHRKGQSKAGNLARPDYKPNKYKLQRLALLDINRLAVLARSCSEARELFERFHEIADSSVSSPRWSGGVNEVKRYS